MKVRAINVRPFFAPAAESAVVTALFDALSLLAAVAHRVSVASLAITAALCFAWLVWCDHNGSTS